MSNINNTRIYYKQFNSSDTFNEFFDEVVSKKLLTRSYRRPPMEKSNIPYAIYLPGGSGYHYKKITGVEDRRAVIYMDTTYDMLPSLQQLIDKYEFVDHGFAPQPDVVYIGVLIPCLRIHVFFYRSPKFDDADSNSFQYHVSNELIAIKIPENSTLPQVMKEMNGYLRGNGYYYDFKGMSETLGSTVCANVYEIPELLDAQVFHNRCESFISEHGEVPLINVLIDDLTEFNLGIMGEML